jgi:TfoX/Sxy family transcriptional regulator of competence genes
MSTDAGLAERVRAAASEAAFILGFDVREKHMFGGLAFMLNNKMACGVVGDELMVRVGPAAYEKALALPHTRPMDFTGRPMRGYVFVAPTGCKTQSAVDRWVKEAATHIQELG